MAYSQVYSKRKHTFTMVRELERERLGDLTAPAANPVFFRTYGRRTEQGRKTWELAHCSTQEKALLKCVVSHKKL